MKIVAIIGSPRGLKGNTARLLSQVLVGAEQEGAETETIVLPGGTVLPCLACDNCHRKGLCPQKDEFTSIKQSILESDGVVLASPNYIFSVSAQLKAFMDRCCGVIHCMAFEGRYGASVVTSGGGDEQPVAEYMNHFLLSTGIIPVGSVWATMGSLKDLPEQIREKARELGNDLVKAWEEKTISPEAEKIKKSFEERMRNLILYRKDDWPYEYRFWKRHRGFE